MNSKKYRNLIYPTRDITDLRDMLRQSVNLYQDRPAYMVKDRLGGPYKKISFKQFGSDVEALGTRLTSLGYAGTRIGVIGENGYEWVTTYMAVTGGVGVIVPLDKELPTGELAGLLERAEVSMIVCSQKMESKVLEAIEGLSSLKAVIKMSATSHEEASKELPEGLKGYSFYRLLTEGREEILSGDKTYLNASIDNREMAILLFTSGTTGLAKGVMLSHLNVVSNVQNMSKYVDVGLGSVGLSVLPMHHTFEMTCHILTSIYQGLTVAFCEGLKYIMKNMVEAEATHMLAVPLIFEQIHKKLMKQANKSGKYNKLRKAISMSRKLKLYNHPEVTKKMFSALHEATGGHMRLFIAGGAAIDPLVIEDFEAMGITMFQGYGMTENAPIIAVNRDRCSKASAAGYVMPETEVQIINEDENGMGEIICKGPSVMLGYYRNQEETAEVLKNGWLYTGDYGKMDSDGFLYICGRKKNVIVTKNGKNIFPEEVEYYLLKSDYIEEVMVLGEPDEKTGDVLIKAIIYPNMNLITEMGHMTREDMEKFFKGIVDDINEEMPLYKRVKRVAIRDTEFEKTTTRKIKRFAASNLT